MTRLTPITALKPLLISGLQDLGLDLNLSEDQIAQLLTYINLLEKWNQTYNLTAIKNPEEMLHRHVLEALSIVKYLDKNKILDVGTGAGIPGLIAAIACPDKVFYLLDSNGKKTRFLTQCIFDLGIQNTHVLNQRVEDCEDQFDIILSRAFSSLKKMIESCQSLLLPGGYFLAMKGPSVDAEIAEISELRGITKFKIEKIPMGSPIKEKGITVHNQNELNPAHYLVKAFHY